MEQWLLEARCFTTRSFESESSAYIGYSLLLAVLGHWAVFEGSRRVQDMR